MTSIVLFREKFAFVASWRRLLAQDGECNFRASGERFRRKFFVKRKLQFNHVTFAKNITLRRRSKAEMNSSALQRHVFIFAAPRKRPRGWAVTAPSAILHSKVLSLLRKMAESSKTEAKRLWGFPVRAAEQSWRAILHLRHRRLLPNKRPAPKPRSSSPASTIADSNMVMCLPRANYLQLESGTAFNWLAAHCHCVVGSWKREKINRRISGERALSIDWHCVGEVTWCIDRAAVMTSFAAGKGSAGAVKSPSSTDELFLTPMSGRKVTRDSHTHTHLIKHRSTPSWSEKIDPSMQAGHQCGAEFGIHLEIFKTDNKVVVGRCHHRLLLRKFSNYSNFKTFKKNWKI